MTRAAHVTLNLEMRPAAHLTLNLGSGDCPPSKGLVGPRGPNEKGSTFDLEFVEQEIDPL